MIFSEKVKFIIILIIIALIKANDAASGDNKNKDPKCLLPMEPGPCRMSLERFYYNAKTDMCEKFKFGGCRGNDNKFGFKETCEDACKKSTGAPTKATATSSAETLKLETDTNTPASSTTTVKPVVARTTAKTLKPTTTKAGVATTTTKKVK